MRKIRGMIVALTAMAFIGSPILTTLTQAATITLPSGKAVEVTQSQLTTLKAQPGIEFVETLPAELPSGQVAVAIPTELGGGYAIGTPSAIASAFNAAGITVGLTAAAVTGATALTTGVILATMAGVIAAALSGEEAAAHHAVSHH